MATKRADLQRLRQDRGYSQRQLANLMGVTQQTISEWERGTATPELQRIEQLSIVLRVDKKELARALYPDLDVDAPDISRKLIVRFREDFGEDLADLDAATLPLLTQVARLAPADRALVEALVARLHQAAPRGQP